MSLMPDFKRLILPHLNREVAPLPDHSTPEQHRQLQAQVSGIMREVLAGREIELDDEAFDGLLETMMDEFAGLGVLEGLLDDERVTEITVIGPKQIFIAYQGERFQIEREFDDEAHLLRTINRLMVTAGDCVDEQHPHASLLRADGSQVEVILPPLARQPTLHIYKNNRAAWTDTVLVCQEMLTSAAMEFLRFAVLARLNIAVIGSGGKRKTTLLDGLIAHIPLKARIVLIEERLKLQLPHKQVIALNPPTRAMVPQLMRQMQALRPDYCIVAGTSGELLAQLSSHDLPYLIDCPTPTTNVLPEMAALCAAQFEDLPEAAWLAHLTGSLNLVVALDWRAGERKVTMIGEVNPDATLTPIWEWDRDRLRVTGSRPRCLGRLENAGMSISPARSPMNYRLMQESNRSV